MINHVSAAWKEHLRMPTTFRADGGHLERYYIDFRGQHYPPVAGTPTFTLIDGEADNQTGSHHLTGGHADYFVALESPTTVHARIKPTFAYNVGTDQVLWAWRIDATHYLALFYAQASDKYVVKWRDGGTERTLESAAYTSDGQLQVWTDIDVVFDSTPALAIAGAVVDSSWSGAVDTLASAFSVFSLRHDGTGTEGGYTVNHLRVFLGYAGAAASIASRYRGVLDEEIHWPLDGHGLGRTRCSITERVQKLTIRKRAAKKKTGTSCANTIDLELSNRNGIFSDDQYAAFDATLQQYNGTSSQKYMQRRGGVTIESWYGGLHEPVFVGRLDEALFSRRTAITQSRVTLSAEDAIADIARVEVPENTAFEDFAICDPTDEDASLIHRFVRLGAQGEVENYLGNSGFENATIANSWAVAGTGATFSRVAGGLLGSYQGDLVYGSAECSFAQTILFTGRRKLSVGETWTLAIYLESAAACGHATGVKLVEADSGGDNGSTSAAFALVGGESWKRFSVTHAIIDAASDRLRFVLTLDDNVTLSVDCAMLFRGSEPVNWFVLNSTDGAAAAISGDSPATSRYDTLGFDVDALADIHPWCLVEEGPWESLIDVADMAASWIMGINSAGTFVFRTPFKAAFADPTPLSVLSSTWDLATEIDEKQPNAIEIGGVKITKSTTVQEAWNAKDAGLEIPTLLDDDEYWPPEADDFWAEYENIKVTRKKTRKWWQWHSHTKLVRRRINDKDIEVLALKAPVTLVSAAMDFTTRATAPLTTVSFDTTSRVGAAQFQLRNETGSQVLLIGASIRGKPVKRGSGSKGFVHDRFRNADAIRADGEVRLEVENNMLVSAAMVDRLAEYRWKEGLTKKHSYEFPLVGAIGLCLEPGDWHTLQIGGAGQVEYVDSTVALMEIEVERTAREPGATSINAREVHENWHSDSTAATRTIASGTYVPGRGIFIFVGASTYVGAADYYCKGTADDGELQAAIYEGAMTGRPVYMSAGVFGIAARVLVLAGVLVIGAGPSSTVLEWDTTDGCFQFDGDGAGVDNLSTQHVGSTNRTAWSIDFNAKAHCSVQRCDVDFSKAQGILCDGDNNKIVGNTCRGGKPADPFTLLGSEIFTTNAPGSPVRAARLDDTHYVIAYWDSSASQAVTAVVVTVDADGVPTPGTPVAVGSERTNTRLDVARLDDTHFEITWSDITTSYPKAVVGVVSSGDVVTFPGSVYTIVSAAQNTPSLIIMDATRSVVLLTETATSDGVGYLITWTSPTTLAFGSKQTWRAAWTFTPHGGATSTTGILAAFYDATNGRYVIELTVNLGTGAIAAAGSAVLFHSSAAADATFELAVLSATTGMVAYKDNTDSDKAKLKVIIATGTTPTVGSVATTLLGTDGVSAVSAAKIDDDQAALVLGNSTDAETQIVVARAFGESATAMPPLALSDSLDSSIGDAILLAGGRFAVAYATDSGGSADDGATVLFDISTAPDSVHITGDNNIMHGCHVLGIAGHTQGVGIRINGDDNRLVDCVVDGLVSSDRRIEGGAVVAGGSRNVITGNTFKNNETKGFMDQGDSTLLPGTNTAFNNGADAGVETF